MPRVPSAVECYTHAEKPYLTPLVLKSGVEIHPVSQTTSAGKETKRSKVSGKKQGYDKRLMLQLVIKYAKVDWEALGKEMGKTTSQCYDTWRQNIYPNLTSNKPWATSAGKSWSAEQKIGILLYVIKSATVDWTAIAENFPGKSKSRVYDQWRQVVLPRLRRGELLE